MNSHPDQLKNDLNPANQSMYDQMGDQHTILGVSFFFFFSRVVILKDLGSHFTIALHTAIVIS